MILRFTVALEPHRKERPRVTRLGTYTPKATLDYEKQVRLAGRDVMRRHGIPVFSEAVVVRIDVRLQPAKSLSKKKRAGMLGGEDPPLIGQSDLDNFVKAVLDGLNPYKEQPGVLKDDRLIVGITARKIASETVGVDVTIEDYREARARTAQSVLERGADLRGGPEPEAPALGPADGAGLEASSVGDPGPEGVRRYRPVDPQSG